MQKTLLFFTDKQLQTQLRLVLNSATLDEFDRSLHFMSAFRSYLCMQDPLDIV